MTLALAAATAILAPTPAGSSAPPDRANVVPIEWQRFDQGLPDSENALLSAEVLLNTNRYALTTWYQGRFGGQTGDYLDLGGTGEHQIRPVGMEAAALAVSLRTGVYDEAVVGVPADDAEQVTLRLVRSIAAGHVSNTPGGWGNAWQSALWAYFGGQAGWLLWDRLGPHERVLVQNMVEHEADRFLDYVVPYYRDAAGTVVSPGDSKAEENAWNAQVLTLATAMMPGSRHWGGWMRKNLELMISAHARPSDLADDRPVNGVPVSAWLNGSNAEENGTVINHARVHPDYMSTVALSTSAVLTYGLAGDPTPRAALFNADVVYAALTDLVFFSPPFAAPGGTIYRRDAAGGASPDLYYPQGNDWGTSRAANFALVDAQAEVLGFDHGQAAPARDWERAHLGTVRAMQSRFADGRTYGAPSEDTYPSREEWVAIHAAQVYQTHWLHRQDAVSFTDRAYPSTPRDSMTHTLAVDVPAFVEPGSAAAVTTTLRSESPGALTGVGVSVTAPAGWRVEPVGPRSWPSVGPGSEVVVRWSVTPPAGTGAGAYPLTASASFETLGLPIAFDQPAAVRVVTPPAGSVQVSDLPFVQERNEWGPVERDQSNGDQARGDGNPLTIDGIGYPKGLGVHALSEVVVYLGGRCTGFAAVVGVDDEVGGRGSVDFQVLADGDVLIATGVLRGSDLARVVTADLTGTTLLTLRVTTGGDGRSFDHADWADARVTCAEA